MFIQNRLILYFIIVLSEYMKKVFLLSCLVGLLMLANAQDTSGFYIKGKIVELKSNDIVPFVTITLGQEAKDTILSVAQSNEEGYFEFLIYYLKNMY